MITHKRLRANQIELTFKASIEEGWHLYSAYLEEGGPKKTSLIIEDQPVKTIDGIQELSEKKEEYDSIFEMKVQFFNNEATFIQIIELTEETSAISGTIDYMVCSDEQCIPLAEDFTITLEETVAASNGNMSEKSLIGFFLFAFLFGLLAILMPCVFPMIPMTVSFFMHGSENRTKAKFQALVFSLSIIVIFFLLGLVVAVTIGPDFTNWLSTHWIPNIFFTLLFLIFAASFFGLFELTLPNWLIAKSDKQADKGGFLAPFFMALTLVLVSFSCTVPIVGWILVEAARGEVIKPIIGMLGFSLAFALPFGFFAFFPSKLSSLPKSGGWLNAVKVVFGFIELALALKFLSVADQTYHWNLLPRDVYIAFWIVIFILLGMYLIGKIKFSHDSDMPFIPVPRLILAIISFSFAVYMIPGMFGAPIKGLAGYLPPQENHSFDLNAIVREHVKQVNWNPSENTTANTGCEEPKYSDFLHLPHGLKGYFDFDQALACAKSQGKPLFIDFTGHGCVNCREMEASVWSHPEVLRRLRDQYVVVALYVDDKTEQLMMFLILDHPLHHGKIVAQV